MFGLRIMTASEVRELVREASLTSACACRRLATPRGLERDGDFGRGMERAVREIDLWIEDLRR